MDPAGITWDTTLIVSLAGPVLIFAGVLVTQAVVNRHNRRQMQLMREQNEAAREAQRGESALAKLTATVELLMKEVDRQNAKSEALASKVDLLEREIEQVSQRHRIVSERYSVALSYIGSILPLWEGLKTRLKTVGFEHGEIPPIPPPVLEDLTDPPFLKDD